MPDPPEDGWRPTTRRCPHCSEDLHGAEARKAGSDIVTVRCPLALIRTWHAWCWALQDAVTSQHNAKLCRIVHEPLDVLCRYIERGQGLTSAYAVRSKIIHSQGLVQGHLLDLNLWSLIAC